MSAQLLFVHALSPLHAGTGQSIGAIDHAIARDRATGYPYLPGTSIKGSLRGRAEAEDVKLDAKTLEAVFGPRATARNSDHAGGVVFGDANLLLLPVRSLSGTFAWVTSPYLLARFARDCSEVKGLSKLPAVGAPETIGECLVAPDSALPLSKNNPRILFEDLDFTQKAKPELKALAASLGARLFPGDACWQQSLEKRLCVVHDDVMTYLAEHGTDVVARVALKVAFKEDAKTVDNLWHEESLPTESVLVSLVTAVPNEKIKHLAGKLLPTLETLMKDPVQLGGKATVGRGRCRLVLTGGAR